MNIEQARECALSLPFSTEDEFAQGWISYRIDGKWFMLIQLDAPEPRIALKFRPEEGAELRERHSEVQPAFHMNHRHWSDIYLNGGLADGFVCSLIRRSYALVAAGLKKSSSVYVAVNELAENELSRSL